jgi:hypothetical protein
MLKYLNKIYEELLNLRNGIEKNIESWKMIEQDPLKIQNDITEINHKDKEIESLRNQLSRIYAEARKLSDEKSTFETSFKRRPSACMQNIRRN